MTEIPGMWRTELWHPMSVHFPIGIILIGSILALISFVPFINKNYSFIRRSARLILLAGIPFVWIAVLTGNEAYEIVGRTLCDPTVKNDHEFFGYMLGWVFTSGALMFVIAKAFDGNYIFWIKVLSGILLFGSLLLTGYVGHLGATLVYQQGAAVYMPDENCNGFE